MKTCTKCHTTKSESEFCICKRMSDGLGYWCRSCHRTHSELRRRRLGRKPRPVIRTTTTKLCYMCKRWKPYADFCKDVHTVDGHTAACCVCQYSRKREYNHTEAAGVVRRQYRHQRWWNDLEYRLLAITRGRIRQALHKTKKSKVTQDLVGCSIAQLKTYLESKWLPGMSWENYGVHGWHIDHIIPCDAFDLTDPEQQVKCFNYTNLQPLWAKANWRKSNKLECKHERKRSDRSGNIRY